MTALPPIAAGQRVADFYARSVPRLFGDLAAAGAAPSEPAARSRARDEWECFALFACVRGIVAASGFAPRTVETIDALHAAVFAGWDAESAGEPRRALLSRRYPEYETLSQAGGAGGAADAAVRLGAAAAAHLAGDAAPAADMAELLGSLHESLAEAIVGLLSGEAVLPEPADAAGASPASAAGGARLAESLPSGVATPPLDGAWRIVERLERAGLNVALGGSGLLAALGLTAEVHDWDFNTDATRDAVIAALDGIEWVHKGADALHADEKFMLPDFELEIIRGFAFFTAAGTVRIPTIVTRRWAGLPVGSPVAWAAAYHLLGREAKCSRLFDWLARHGADREALEALLAQPLPEALAARLAALPLAAD